MLLNIKYYQFIKIKQQTEFMYIKFTEISLNLFVMRPSMTYFEFFTCIVKKYLMLWNIYFLIPKKKLNLGSVSS